ncbi:hypothetical protein GF373_17770 [bacterium]|nr:hypothetical protein [bacterium]
MTLEELAECVAILGSTSRLKILRALETTDYFTLEDDVFKDIPAAWYHMNKLRSVGFVTSPHQGGSGPVRIFFRVNKKKLYEVLSELEEVVNL